MHSSWFPVTYVNGLLFCQLVIGVRMPGCAGLGKAELTVHFEAEKRSNPSLALTRWGRLWAPKSEGDLQIRDAIYYYSNMAHRINNLKGGGISRWSWEDWKVRGRIFIASRENELLPILHKFRIELVPLILCLLEKLRPLRMFFYSSCKLLIF